MMAFLSALKMLSRNVWIINYRVSKNNLRDSSFCLALNTIHQIKNAPNTRLISRQMADQNSAQYMICCKNICTYQKNTVPLRRNDEKI